MSGLAEVLSAHAFVVLDFDQRGGACFCGDEFKWKLPTIHSKINALATHQAEVLAAAGFGPVKEAGAADWMTEATQGSFEALRREMQAKALEDAADELARLDRIAERSPEITEDEATDFDAFWACEGDINWLRARAAAVRSDS